MKFDSQQLKLYAITDRSWLKENETIYDIVEQAIDGGATLIQVREKTLARESFIREVKEIKPLCHRNGIALIVNDDVSVAIDSGADGVHVGQSDLEGRLVKSMIPSSMILGISAQSVEQAIKAKEDGATYLGVGAVFPTSTKDDADALNTTILKQIAESVDIPTVAIGGICKDNIPLLRGTSIAGISVISAIFAEKNIRKATADLLDIVKRTNF